MPFVVLLTLFLILPFLPIVLLFLPFLIFFAPLTILLSIHFSGSSPSVSSSSSSNRDSRTSWHRKDSEDDADSSDPDHLSDAKFRSLLNDMRLSNELCDVDIVAEEEAFPAHKNVLSACSNYFRTMFRHDSGFRERRSNRIVIDPNGELGIRAKAVKDLFVYIYTGEINLSAVNAVELVQAADLLDLPQVKMKAMEFLVGNVSLDNYIIVRQKSLFDSPALQEAVIGFARKHFRTFVQTQAFLDMDEMELVGFLRLQEDQLRGSSEEVALEAVLAWCKSNGDMGKCVGLVRHIRFHLISDQYLERYRRDNQAVANLWCDKFLQDRSLQVRASRRQLESGVLVAMTYSARIFHFVFLTGDHIEWTTKSLPHGIFRHLLEEYSVCIVGKHYIFLTGSKDSAVGFLYDVVNDLWIPSSDIPYEIRKPVSLSSVGNDVFFSYETNNESKIIKMDFCLPQGQRKGQPVAKMRGHPYDANLISSGELLYAIGGKNVGSSDVEVYTPEQDVWRTLASMNETRSNASLAEAAGKIYVVGGDHDPFGVECYDTVMDSWMRLPHMRFPRRSPVVVCVNSKLFVFGGGHVDGLANPVEVFDLASHEWSEATVLGNACAFSVGCFIGG